MDELVYQKSYPEFREELRSELKRTAEGFVKIGYLLKVARDTDILKTSGYSGLEDFARGEFDLDKTQVSRFIRINERFSEGGNSDRLMTGYADFGVRKLGLMLTLPDVINEELSPGYTVEEITSIKETYDEEQKVTPIEDYIEQTEAKEENNKAARLAETDMLSAVLYQIGHDDPELFIQMFESENLLGDTDLFSVLAPGGESTHKVRIKGVGGILVTCNDTELTITNLRTLAKESIEWEKVNQEFNSMLDRNLKLPFPDAKEAWQQVYGEEYSEKTEVAPVQPEKKSKVVDHTKKETPKKPQTQEICLPEPVSGEKEEKQPVKEAENRSVSLAEAHEEGKKDETAKEEKEEILKTDETEHETDTEEPQEEDKAAVLEDYKDVTPEKVFEGIERNHGKASEIARYISNTLSYETGELDDEDIADLLERLKKLKMHLEFMKGGYEEYRKMKGIE